MWKHALCVLKAYAINHIHADKNLTSWEYISEIQKNNYLCSVNKNSAKSLLWEWFRHVIKCFHHHSLHMWLRWLHHRTISTQLLYCFQEKINYGYCLSLVVYNSHLCIVWEFKCSEYLVQIYMISMSISPKYQNYPL
jgi:hypothetical protein